MKNASLALWDHRRNAMPETRTLPRRAVLAGLGCGALLPLASSFPRPAVASQQSVKLTLPWLAQGATAYAYIARERGLFRGRGLDVEISRGYGSVAAVQAVANKQFDVGIAFVGPALLSVARGLPLVGVTTFNYDALFGIAVRADSTIREPKDLEGKKLGVNPTSAEVPFWPAFVRKTGIDLSKVTIVQMDSRVLERSLVDKQVDAIMCVGSSSIPVIQALNAEYRFMLWSKYGLDFYANALLTRPDILGANAGMVKAISEALQEALKFQLLDPAASLEILIKQVPEMGLTKGGRESALLSQGMMQRTLLVSEAMTHALGYTDLAKVETMADMVMEFAAPADAKRPNVPDVFNNRFVGGFKLSTAEWTKVKEMTEPFGKLLG
jgi:NitT/TauT family transport system substrate-binding protein